VVGRDLAALPYPDRLTALKGAGVGLWDVIAGAERRGSLDADIRNAEAADLRQLITDLPNLSAVAFNGATAAKIGRRSLAGVEGLALIDLPSSSPAHAARSFAQKAEAWAVLEDVLRD
jgi:TDG/mug DNA glycosylase family protein